MGAFKFRADVSMVNDAIGLSITQSNGQRILADDPNWRELDLYRAFAVM